MTKDYILTEQLRASSCVRGQCGLLIPAFTEPLAHAFKTILLKLPNHFVFPIANPFLSCPVAFYINRSSNKRSLLNKRIINIFLSYKKQSALHRVADETDRVGYSWRHLFKRAESEISHPGTHRSITQDFHATVFSGCHNNSDV